MRYEKNIRRRLLMWNDEIVEEIRQVADQYAKEHHYNINEIYDDLKTKEQASGRQIVCFTPKRPLQYAVPPDKKAVAA